MFSEQLEFPPPVSEFLSVHNGARLLSGGLNLSGVVAPGTLLNRSDPFALPPFNIEDANKWQRNSDEFLFIGGYKQDGSRAGIGRSDSRIYVFKRKSAEPFSSWNSLEEWLTSEVTRLGSLFSPDGRSLGPLAELGPAHHIA